MESDDAFCRQTYSCALCENLNDLSAPCCCQEDTENMTEITEPRLLKRCNLQHGDMLCSSHYEKLNSGTIFGGGGGCCAPFHVGQTVGMRLRPVPRIWRSLFDNSDITSRYLPSLQICGQCYNITLDLVLNADHNNNKLDCNASDSADASSKSNYTSPRRWLSSASLHMPGSSTSGSTWSLNSSQYPARSSSNLLSLYAAQSEKLGHPRAVPDSVKRFFRYSKQNGPPSKQELEPNREESLGAEAGDHKEINCTNSSQETQQFSFPSVASDDTEKEESLLPEARNHLKGVPMQVSLSPTRNINEFTNQKETEASKDNLSFAEHLEKQLVKFSPILKQSEYFGNATQCSGFGKTIDAINRENQVVQKENNKIGSALSSKGVDITVSCEQVSVPRDNNYVECKTLPITVKSVVSQQTSLQKKPIVKSEKFIPLKNYFSPYPLPPKVSNILYVEIAQRNNLSRRKTIDKIKSSVNSKNTNQASLLCSNFRRMETDELKLFLKENFTKPEEVSPERISNMLKLFEKVTSSTLKVFANTTAQCIIDFALEDVTTSLRQANRQKQRSISVARKEVRFLTTVFEEVKETLQSLKVCNRCAATLLSNKVCTFHDPFANNRANNTQFNTFQQTEKNSSNAQLSDGCTTFDDNFSESNSQRHLTQIPCKSSAKLPNEQRRYRTELTFRVNETTSSESSINFPTFLTHTSQSDKTTALLLPTESAIEGKNTKKHEGSPRFKVTECIVEDILPVTRSFSTGYLDKCDEDEGYCFPLVRSSSLDSFFTVTYQLHDELESSENEFVVVPIDKKRNLSKEPESGVFMSAPVSDNSCATSIANSLPVYSDIDQDSEWSWGRRNSSADNIQEITAFSEIFTSDDTKSDTKNSTAPKSTVKEELIAPTNLQASQVCQSQSDLTQSIQKEKENEHIPERCIKVSEETEYPLADNTSSYDNDSLAPRSTQAGESDDMESAISENFYDSNQEKLLPQAEASCSDEIENVLSSQSDDLTSPEDGLKSPEESEVIGNTEEEQLQTNQTNQDLEVQTGETLPENDITRNEIDEDQDNEVDENSPSHQQTNVVRLERQTTIDWYPSDDVMRQRRSNQFVRAISQAALLSSRVRTAKRERLRKTDEDSEDDDVNDIISIVMEENTPQYLRRKTKIIAEDSQSFIYSKFVIRAVAVLIILCCFIVVWWRRFLTV